MKKYGYLFLILGVLSQYCYSGTKPENLTIQLDQKSKFDLKPNDSMNAVNLLNNKDFLNWSMPTMLDVAKRACGYAIKPQSITVSIGVISATWETDKLCPQSNKK